MDTKQNKGLARYFHIAWIYTKYQILTKALLFFIAFPLYKYILKLLIHSTGRVTISSGDYIGFLMSPQGVGMLMLTFIFLALLIAIDINAFIIMSALIHENRINLTARQLLVVAIFSLKNFLRPSGFLIMVYIALVVPLVGFGLGISVTENFQIPNFITDVIYKNDLYRILYNGALFILTIVTFLYIFFFHYMIIAQQSIKDSLYNSYRLMRNHRKNFLWEFIIKTLLLFLLIGVIFVLVFLLITLRLENISDETIRRISTIFVIVIITEVGAYFSIMIVPIIVQKLTKLFYKYNHEEGRDIKLKIDIDENILKRKKNSRTWTILGGSAFIILVLLFDGAFATLTGIFFDEIFRTERKIDIIAHRAGGDLAAENSIKGLERAIEVGANWGEIDVQRIKDGKYIINHDPTFERVAGVNKTSSELTLDEIKKLKIKDLFDPTRPSQPVATIEEFLDSAKDKIGLFIELKGSTANEKMADDVIKLIKEKGMQDQVAILSLDYSLIKYIEENYPEINTGFLYFFSVGDINKVISDFLIMEEEQATDENIEKIQREGKKAIVWTVNTESSIEHFLNTNADGVISDHVLKVEQGEIDRDNRSDMEIILDTITR